MTGAKACTAAPKVKSAPAINTVRLRPIRSAISPPAKAPSNAPKVTQDGDDLDDERAQGERRFDALQRPGNDALVIAEQAAGK